MPKVNRKYVKLFTDYEQTYIVATGNSPISLTNLEIFLPIPL
jgi:hypothetical protein